ncbi:DNA-directed RNA polymerase subunit beta' [Striga asiatica]|uniref:DNA-directed RNA polymerase subunit beta n=1 Tax=Striga asiatica TaxID=4170 RepID=A0A5A7NXP3_STRAF|nr:DNA-directed RNA polymerase subunit beta' [Striga asiatica]
MPINPRVKLCSSRQICHGDGRLHGLTIGGKSGPKRSSGTIHREIKPLGIPRPITKKSTFFRLRGLFEYEIQSWKYIIPPFFYYPRFRYISQSRNLYRCRCYSRTNSRSSLRIILEKRGPRGMNGKIDRRIDLAKHFLRTNIEPVWMVLCLLPILPPELRPAIQIEEGKFMSSYIIDSIEELSIGTIFLPIY